MTDLYQIAQKIDRRIAAPFNNLDSGRPTAGGQIRHYQPLDNPTPYDSGSTPQRHSNSNIFLKELDLKT